MYQPGPLNLITDVAGLRVGNAEDVAARTGVTVVLPENSMTASGDVRGGAPGTRETDALDPTCLVEQADAMRAVQDTFTPVTCTDEHSIKETPPRECARR